jgi:hypothetical protein
VYPAFGADAGYKVVSDYDVGGDPLVSSVHKVTLAGAQIGGMAPIEATIDLLGRTVRYEDVWGTVTVPTYSNQVGRLTEVSVTTPGWAAKVQQFVYDDDGKVLTVKDDSGGIKVIAQVSYDPATGEMTGEMHPTGTKRISMLPPSCGDVRRTLHRPWEVRRRHRLRSRVFYQVEGEPAGLPIFGYDVNE